jgi:hypothetical protein
MERGNEGEATWWSVLSTRRQENQQPSFLDTAARRRYPSVTKGVDGDE